MSFFEHRGDLNFERKGQSVSVPNNDVAKCMYYLNCVFKAIEYDDNDMRRYTDYENYWNLTDEEIRVLFILCLTFSPDEFEDKVFFESDAMTGPFSGNEFYEVTQVRHRLMAVQSIIIAGQVRHVKQIMTYKRSWMQNYYFGPMQRLHANILLQKQREEAIRRAIAGPCVIS